MNFIRDLWIVFFILPAAKLQAVVPLHEKNPPLYRELFSIDMSTVYQCMELCWAYKICKTLSYCKSTRRCFLHNFPISHRSVIRLLSGCVVLTRQRLPQLIHGHCQDHACDVDEMCVSAPIGYTCVKHELSTVNCPEYPAQYHGTCVMPVFQRTTWDEAENRCQDGATLVEIFSYEFHLLVTSLATSSCWINSCDQPKRYWLGLRYSIEQSAFVWNSSGKILRSTDFHMFLDFPSNITSKLCVGMSEIVRGIGLSWSLLDCEDENFIMCQDM
ncbi:uncharacterized protein LOC132559948 [Ylistrum balloti]|uniref:uncharacterized protein LOC132559948 n=1 Tax=Ylistrum balloti TaxID=509963 RepID=UPI002905F12E|nr:uncharacterized protein LOC132559948 [Ylistrum balloti]